MTWERCTRMAASTGACSCGAGSTTPTGAVGGALLCWVEPAPPPVQPAMPRNASTRAVSRRAEVEDASTRRRRCALVGSGTLGALTLAGTGGGQPGVGFLEQLLQPGAVP